MAASNPTLMYQIQQISGKGQGLIASRNITRGERILSESPLFTLPNIDKTIVTSQNLNPRLQGLNDAQQQTFYNLFNNHVVVGITRAVGIVKTNALHVDSDTDAIFPTFSRLNHSCLPNASYSWNGNIMKGILHAIRDITAGEEIAIEYGDHRRGSTGRSTCLCPLCSTHDQGRLAKSDDRREKMMELEDLIWERTGIQRDPEDVLKSCRDLDYLLCAEYENSSAPVLAELYEFAAGLAAAHSDGGRTIAFTRWAHAVRRICEGDDNPNTQNCLLRIESPWLHPKWGRTSWWDGQLQTPPSQSQIEEYVEWIWRWGR